VYPRFGVYMSMCVCLSVCMCVCVCVRMHKRKRIHKRMHRAQQSVNIFMKECTHGKMLERKCVILEWGHVGKYLQCV
jgi:hypothetical protein